MQERRWARRTRCHDPKQSFETEATANGQTELEAGVIGSEVVAKGLIAIVGMLQRTGQERPLWVEELKGWQAHVIPGKRKSAGERGE